MDQMREYLLCLGAYPEAMEAAMDKAAARGMDLEELLGLIVDALAGGDLDCYLEQISPGNSYLAWEDRCTGLGAMDAIEDKVAEWDKAAREAEKMEPSKKRDKLLKELDGRREAWKQEAQDLINEYSHDLGSKAKNNYDILREVHHRHADKTALLGDAGITAAAEQRVYRLWNEKHFDFF